MREARLSSEMESEMGNVQRLFVGLETVATNRCPFVVACIERYCSTPKLIRCGILRSTSIVKSHGPEPSSAVATKRTVGLSRSVGDFIQVLGEVSLSACPPVERTRHKSISYGVTKPLTK